MMLYLVHHADALGPQEDARRPLSARGLRQAESVGGQIQARGARPAMVWHSGKLRARETAEICWRAVNPLAELKMIRGLRPEDAPDVTTDLVEMEERDVMLVSHMPLLPALAAALTGGPFTFPANGAVALERVGPRRYEERWRVSPSV